MYIYKRIIAFQHDFNFYIAERTYRARYHRGECAGWYVPVDTSTIGLGRLGHS